MKLSSIFSIVVGIHLLVIASLFILPGCQSGPKADPADTALRPTGEPRTPAEARELDQGFNAGMTSEPAPSRRVSPADGPRLLTPPTRPVRQLESGPARMLGEGTTADAAPRPAVPVESTLTPVASTPRAPREPAAATRSIYTVVAGDNLTVIARRHGVTVTELLDANQLRRDAVLRVGQQLDIPAAADLSGPVQPVAPQYRAVDVDHEGRVYTVVSGDTLSGIASRHGTSVAAIRTANQLQSDMIRVGQELLIPQGGTAAPAPRPQPRPAIVPTTGRDSPARPNERGDVTYEVRPGDTLDAIARRFDVPYRTIMERNGITDPRRLRAGQQLIIPTELRPVPERPSRTQQPARVEPVPSAAAGPEIREVFEFEDLEDIPEVPVEESN